MTYKVYAPNVHLFAFHLRTPLATSLYRDEPADNLLWQKCDQIFDKLHIDNLNLTDKLSQNPSDSPRVDLLFEEMKENKFSLPFDSHISLTESQALKIAGFVYPLQTHDSYALWLNLRRPERENGKRTDYVDISLLGKLNPENCLLPAFVESSLGQTLLITLWLTEGQNYQDKHFLKELSDQCINHFISDPNCRPKFNREGLLFGSPIFEYGIINQPPPYQHILVWLFSHSVTDTKFEKCYKELMDLFYYRNKIIQAYKTSRDVYNFLYEEYTKVEQEVHSIEDLSEGSNLNLSDMRKFKKLLKRLPKTALEYSRLMRDLDQCQHTIRLNTQNYEEKVARIQAKLQSDNLVFLETFSQKNCVYLQEEIQADLRYLGHGSKLLEKMLSAIRGMVEIEQAERYGDRQQTIKWLGIGLGTAVLTASSSAHITPTNPLRPPLSTKSLHPFTIAVFTSILVGILAALTARWLLQRSRD
ncbi:hypothetical protein NG798_21925 [Ancylothrix sp. C2]|uniref:hypothetical protein n=1 Tax=Ancylothrix sp. D3o TaxID=2953691 RepID=UPI0021BB7334|nr:hypothetical protein [Ancylothrix sp. D3o]MCT7952456.1 hypothetical protein [Ancylothrix sp. D3o]